MTRQEERRAVTAMVQGLRALYAPPRNWVNEFNAYHWPAVKNHWKSYLETRIDFDSVPPFKP